MRNAIEILLPHSMSDSVLKKFFYQRKILDMFKIHSRFFVTLTLEPICETVPLHVLGHNFLFCGWNLKSDIPK